MKRTLLSILLGLLALTMGAQTYMNIQRKDGATLRVALSDISNVSFEVETLLEVTPTQKIIGAEGGTIEFIVHCNTDWTARVLENPQANGNRQWLKLAPGSGEGSGEGMFTLIAEANQSIKPDTKKVVVSAGSQNVTVEITQEGAEPYGVANPSKITFSPTGGTLSVTLKSNTSWSVYNTYTWISVNPEGMPQIPDPIKTTTLSITATENTGASARKGELFIASNDGALLATIQIEQVGFTPPSLSIYTENATENLPYNGASLTISVESNTSWEVTTTGSDWISFSRKSGSGSGSFTASIGSNSSTNIREAKIAVKTTDGSQQATINISQQAYVPPTPTLDVSIAPNASYTADNFHVTLNVTSNSSWTVSSSQSWISLSRTQGNGNGNVMLTASQNTQTIARTARITISNGTKNLHFDFTQEAAKTSKLFEPPVTAWTSSKATVTSKMSAFSKVIDTTLDDGSNVIAYEGKYKELATYYWFDTSFGLYQSRIAIATSNATLTQLDAELKKVYTYIEDYKGAKMYVLEGSAETATLVALYTNTNNNNYIIDYMSVAYLDQDENALFEQPYLTWGATRSTVKSTMSSRGYTIMDEQTTADKGFSIVYSGKLKEAFSVYLFDASQKLNLVEIILSASLANVSSVATFMEEELEWILVDTNSDGSVVLAHRSTMSAAVITSTSIGNNDVTEIQILDLNSILEVKGETRAIDNGEAITSAVRSAKNQIKCPLEPIINDTANTKSLYHKLVQHVINKRQN